MNFLKLAKKNREVYPKSWENFRETKIVQKVRSKRTSNEELAILRKSVKQLYDIVSNYLHISINNEEFSEYYDDVEAAKEKTNKELEIY